MWLNFTTGLHTRMKQRYHYLAYNICSVNWALPINYQLLFILNVELSLFDFCLFSCVFLYINYFFAASEKLITLTKRSVVKGMIQSFVVRQFYNSLVTVCGHKEARNSSERQTRFPILKLLKQHTTTRSWSMCRKYSANFPKALSWECRQANK